jgi:predicted glutamine amidotransferase
MCGLVGVLYKGTNGFCASDRDIFEDMLYMDALRGDDSVGVAAFYNDGSAELVKEALVHVMDFMEEEPYKQVHTNLVSKGKAVIGHNRKATKGKVVEENAHPWLLDNRFLFMHNGTLHSWKHLADTEVDSEALGIHLTKCEGDKAKLEEALSSVHGAYACVWIDQLKEKLYILRNKERPLCYGVNSFGVTFASEPGFVAAACARRSTKISLWEEVEVETLYEFDLSVSGDVTTPVKTKLEVKKATASTHKGAKGIGQDNKATTMGSKQTKSGGAKGTAFFRDSPSRNSLKRFKKQFLNSSLDFYCDDYISATETDSDNWWLTGESWVIETPHQIYGFYTGSEESALDITDRIISGTISQVMYDAKLKIFKIYLSNLITKSYVETYYGKTHENVCH